MDEIAEKHLSLLHSSTRRFSGNFDWVINLLSTLDLEFSKSRIIETWLKESDHLCDILGCNSIYEHNINSYWGRCWFIFECGFWVKMPPQIRLWQQYSKRVICWISLTKEERYNRRRDLYTTHTHLREFCDELVGLVLCLSKCNKLCILLEDWNLEIMKHEQHRLTEIFGCNVLKNVFPSIYAPENNRFAYCNFAARNIH